MEKYKILSEEMEEMTRCSIGKECAKFINNYMEIYRHYYSEKSNRDDAFLKDLADAFIGISAVLEVYARNFEIHPDYVLQKLNNSKSYINTTIDYFKNKEK